MNVSARTRFLSIRRRLSVATILWALGTTTTAVAAAPSRDCGPPPDGALCVEGAWLDFAQMDVTLRQGTVTVTLDSGCGFGGNLVAACLDRQGDIVDSIEA